MGMLFPIYFTSRSSSKSPHSNSISSYSFVAISFQAIFVVILHLGMTFPSGNTIPNLTAGPLNIAFYVFKPLRPGAKSPRPPGKAETDFYAAVVDEHICLTLSSCWSAWPLQAAAWTKQAVQNEYDSGKVHICIYFYFSFFSSFFCFFRWEGPLLNIALIDVMERVLTLSIQVRHCYNSVKSVYYFSKICDKN